MLRSWMPHCCVTISGVQISDEDNTDDTAAVECDLADITRSLESIKVTSYALRPHISCVKAKVQNTGAICIRSSHQCSNHGGRAEFCLHVQVY